MQELQNLNRWIVVILVFSCVNAIQPGGLGNKDVFTYAYPSTGTQFDITSLPASGMQMGITVLTNATLARTVPTICLATAGAVAGTISAGMQRISPPTWRRIAPLVFSIGTSISIGLSRRIYPAEPDFSTLFIGKLLIVSGASQYIERRLLHMLGGRTRTLETQTDEQFTN